MAKLCALSVDSVVSPVGADATRPEVGIDDAGNAFVSWQSSDGIVTYVRDSTIFGRARSTTGALSGAADMTGGADTIFGQSMSLDGTGQAIVAWVSGRYDSRTVARTRASTGHLNAITPLSTGGTDVVTDFVRAVPGGVGWVRYTPSRTAVLQLRRLVGGSWQPVENLTPTSIKAANVVAAAGGGRIVFAFSSFENGGLEVRVRARERRPDGSYGPLSILSAENGNGGGSPRLAANASGQAAASWFARLDPSGFDLVWVGTNFLL